MVTGWRDRTPQGFVFAAKVPKLITSIKILRDCEQELSRFLKVMEPLGEKLGPLLLQFPYFNKTVFASREQFDQLLRPFLNSLPKEFRFLEHTRDHSVGFALLAQARMPGIDNPAKALDLVTADFCYVRFMGNRKGLESQTRRFDKIIEDKTDDMTLWGTEIKKIAS